MRLLTVIVNYRTATHVVAGLDALVPQLEELGDAEAWIVDNASPDDSVPVLRRAIEERGFGSRVRLLESSVNGGFGAGNNVAIREALASSNPPDIIYLLNPDATPAPGALGALVRFFETHPSAAAVGTAIHGPDGEPHTSTFRFPTLLGEFEWAANLGVLSRLLGDYRIPMEVPETSCKVDWVSGASVAFRRETLERVGLFDERFFLYFEEVDLCHRVREAGLEVWFAREATVAHVGSVVTGVTGLTRTPAYWFESRAHYLEKNHGATRLFLSNLVFLAGFTQFRARSLLLQRAYGGRPYFLTDFVRHTLLASKKP